LEGTKKKNNSIQVKVSDSRHTLCFACIVYCIHVVQLHAQSPDISSVHDPFTIPFDRILHFFFVRTPSGQFVCQICSF